MDALGSVRRGGLLKCLVVAALAATFASTPTQGRVARVFERAALGFEPNRGQFEGPARFVAYGRGYTLKLSPAEATMDLGRPEGAAEPVQVRMKVLGGNPGAAMRGDAEQPGRSHYFRGNDPARWLTNVPSYARVAEESVYPGIDLVYHGEADRLEWDFVVAPGTDAGRIRLRFEGAGPLRLDGNGDLVVETAAGVVRQKRPVLYQDVGGHRRTVGGAYALRDEDEVGFQVAAYDATRPLVIDPEIVYSTYVAGCRGRQGIEDLALDSAGNAYAVGYHPAGCDRETSQAWVVEYGPDGKRIASALFGGLGGTVDAATGVAVDAADNVYVTGWSDWSAPGGPPPFPTTADAFQRTNAGVRDAFMTKFGPGLGSIQYSTLLGGSGDDVGTDVAVGEEGTVYVVGRTASPDFPSAEPAQPVPGG
ncbi:MAG TPA: SBBP repeat-containing protein, partial [Vicinamibacteria bacterium]